MTKDFIANWLLILKPGQGMYFIPEDLGVLPATVQWYVSSINTTTDRKYKTLGGGIVRNSKRERMTTNPALPVWIKRIA